MKDLIIDCFAGGGTDREQRGSDHGEKACGSELSVSEGWRENSESED